MRQLRDGPILATPGNALQPTNPDHPAATFDILAFARTVLGKGTPELLAVTTWARMMAAGDFDASIAQWCRDKGRPERTFHRRRVRACEVIAIAKNRTDGAS
ncbi:hypothetical protein [Methylobacterium sp. A54F]